MENAQVDLVLNPDGLRNIPLERQVFIRFPQVRRIRNSLTKNKANACKHFREGTMMDNRARDFDGFLYISIVGKRFKKLTPYPNFYAQI